MPPRLTTNYAKNYCNRTLIVKVILENVVTCFLLGHSISKTSKVLFGSGAWIQYSEYCWISNLPVQYS